MEKHILQQLFVNHRHQDIRTCAAGHLLLDGLSAPKTAVGLEVPVYIWSRLWKKQDLCDLLSGHDGGRPRALSEIMPATTIEVASAKSMTPGQTAKHIEAVYGEPMLCPLKTLSVALRRKNFSFRRNRFALKKTQP